MSSLKPEKFRETLWFKKGELDADEAIAATDAEDDLAPAAADLLPVEDRYRDDGSLTEEDRLLYGVHTGSTQHIEPIQDGDEELAMDDREIVGEMKRGRRPVLALCAAGLAGIAALVLTFVS